jgi:uncharacterized protein (UPF0276 family)
VCESGVSIEASSIDFVELPSENFFAQGGASRALIKQVAANYPVSLHSTALGLGSKAAIAGGYLESLNELVQTVNPFLMSDHAAFSWAEIEGKSVHAGDLLPIVFNQKNLNNMANNIDAVQQLTGQRLLIENLSAYIQPSLSRELKRQSEDSVLAETEFLIALTELTQCGLLIDLNNLVVNANNFSTEPDIDYAKQWLQHIPSEIVGEIHLAGFTPVNEGELAIDDHSQAISDTGWQLYQFALQRFGAVPTLIEWDNNLPSWQELLGEASKARLIANAVMSHE